jgi:hypothetical protein
VADIDQELAQMTDEGLATLHGRLDESDPSVAAEAQAHHLVTTEILRRGGSHGHDGDDWGKTVILVDSVEVESAEEIAAPDGMEKAWGDALADGGVVSVLLTVNGYVLKADPTVSEVHVDSVMGKPRRRKAKRVMVDELTDYEKRSVPEVFADLDRNLENRQHAIDEYLYGPMNPEEPGDYWKRLGDMWDVSAAEAATTRCGNCAAFNVSLDIRSAMAEAIGEGGEQVVSSADLGYCELLDFKCAASRSCSAWLTGGPIGSDADGEEAEYEKSEEQSEEEFLAGLTDAALAWYGDIGFLIDNDGDPELLLQKAGNPEPLRDYWRGGGKGKISWGAGGDFTACAAAVGKYMTSEQAKGYCAIRHREVTGMWPGDKRNRPAKKSTGAVDVVKHGKHDQSSHGRKGGGDAVYGEGSGGGQDAASGGSTYGGYDLGKVDNPPGEEGKRRPDSIAAARAERGRVAAIEPEITRDIIDVANNHGGKVEGLEFRLKSEKSLARKVDAERDDPANGGDPKKTAESMSDVARYTITYKDSEYVRAAEATVKDLEKQGYELRVKNYWQPGDPYQGINIAAVHPNGTRFELQLHTPTSLDFKEPKLSADDPMRRQATHVLYEEYRESGSMRVRVSTYNTMRRQAAQIPVPPPPDRLRAIGEPKFQPLTSPSGEVIPLP